MSEITINGKVVVLRDGPFRASEFHAAFTAIMTTELQTGDFAQDTKPLMAFVESWEFKGAPDKTGAWGNLNYIREYVPIRNAIMEIVNVEFGDDEDDEGGSKN